MKFEQAPIEEEDRRNNVIEGPWPKREVLPETEETPEEIPVAPSLSIQEQIEKAKLNLQELSQEEPKEDPQGPENSEGNGILRSMETSTEYKKCEVCDGSGRKWLIFPCPACEGWGRVPGKRTETHTIYKN